MKADGKAKTLESLRIFGHEIGEDGSVWADSNQSSDSQPSEPEQLKREIEAGEAPKTYGNCFSVGCSLLRPRSFQPDMEWFERIMGEEYDEEKTYYHLKNAVESYPEEYGHVEIPPLEEFSKMK